MKAPLLSVIAIAFGAATLKAQDVPGAGNVFFAVGGPYMQLFGDPNFANGFRADASCTSYEGGPNGLRLGNCLQYTAPYVNSQYGRNYSVHTWPDPGPPNDAGKYWDLVEGDHSNFSQYGYAFPPGADLAVHRFEANQENGSHVSFGDASQIFLQSFNNLVPQAPNYGGLIRSLVSNKAGQLTMYMNSRNEIQNVATTNGPEFAQDTWPHYYVGERFRQLIDLATFSVVNLNITLTTQMQAPWLSWMSPAPGGGFSEATLGVGFTLREKRNPYKVAFMGYKPYSVWKDVDGTFIYPPPPQEEKFGAEQNGAIDYRGNVADIGGPMGPNETRTLYLDLDTLFNKAVARALIQGPNGVHPDTWQTFVSSTLDDYFLAGVGFGWETMGYQDVQSTISNVTLFGHSAVIFDSEVYQDDYYRQMNQGINAWNGGTRRAHWAKEGLAAGLVASPTFDVKIYAQNNRSAMPQCIRGNGTVDYVCAAMHYVFYGRSQGRSGRPGPGGFGLRATYYNNRDFTGPKAIRTDPTVNFEHWGLGSPDYAIAPDTFTVRWEGKVVPRYSQTYVFSTIADDGVRLWVNGQLIIDDWTQHGPTRRGSAPLMLYAGVHYNIKLEYFEEGGGASIQLRWRSASQPEEIIPQSRLYPAPYPHY